MRASVLRQRSLAPLCVTAGGASGSLGVLAELAEVHGYARLVADNPRIVTRRTSEDVAGADFDLAPVVHPNSHAAGDDVGKMRNLARISPGNRLHVVRPAPAGFERAATNRLAADLENVRPAVSLERAYIVGRVEVLDFGAWHCFLLATWVGGLTSTTLPPLARSPADYD